MTTLLLKVVLLLAIAFGSLGGTLAATADSLPDSAVYPLKLAMEQAQLTIDDENRGTKRLDDLHLHPLKSLLGERRLTQALVARRQGEHHPLELGNELPELVDATDVLGPLTADAADELGENARRWLLGVSAPELDGRDPA